MTAELSYRVQIMGEEFMSDALGIWQAVPAGPELLKLGSGQPVTLWDVSLPEDPDEAIRLVTGRTWLLETAQSGMPQAQQRLEAMLQNAASKAPGDAESFSQVMTASPAPERELAALLYVDSGAADFFDLGQMRQDLEDAALRFRQFAEGAQNALTYLAFVQTSQAGRMLGRTSVAWLGDVETVWSRSLGRSAIDLHTRNLSLALRTRQSWLRLVLLVSGGALKLSTLLASGAGAVLAIPAAWRFFNQVLAEIRQVRADSGI